MIEDIITYLERSTQEDAELSISLDLGYARSGESSSDHETRGNESPRLLIMDSDNICYTIYRLLIECISYLSECDSEVSGTLSELRDHRYITQSRDPLECHRLECVSDEDRHGLTVLFPDGWESTTEYVVIHTWEIIMDEGITVHELNPDEPIDDSIGTILSGRLFIDEDSEDGPQPLATSLDSMPESRDELSLYSGSNSTISISKKSR